MGKLNIAHHKSYHPYRRDNIEKVRRDEEEAKLKEAKEEGRLMLADSEARIDLLRKRGPSGKKKEQIDEDFRPPTAPSISTSGGHINFFEDLEQNAITAAVRVNKKTTASESEKGFALAPSSKDLNPWYSNKNREQGVFDDENEERRKRDSARKSLHDPLTSITHQLASSSSMKTRPSQSYQKPTPVMNGSHPPEVNARIARESTERERALALIRRRKREMEGSETPSTVHGGVHNSSGYGDMYNRRDVEEAHRTRDRRWDDSRPPRSRSWSRGEGRAQRW
ncbi:hypothetical protein E1B28_011763 [Marasmius oreades]|uniref:CBF1-interacting co-repressor CIR N-terminal domain-containing protein n=1 Tax=Marasmius oreades TaxID=181124 RepID=A0A9P7USG1_9AGAR|nr:uncharacterized protein E1B28_011763 [Marasmius oreades]KAG7090154.1 hypothetical protein E1B28_011763 [Marasmius oreades]